jgi:hypothetical protein
MRAIRDWFGRLVRASALLTLSACASVPEPQVVIGRISLASFVVDGPTLGGLQHSVYEVRPEGSPSAPIFLTILAPCPFDHDHPESNDPEQLYRIEFESSGRDYWLSREPYTDFVTTKCEHVEG